MPRETSTGGLPQLVRTLYDERPEKDKNPNAEPPSSGVVMMGFLHCLVLVLLLTGTLQSNEARDFRDAAAYLPNGGTLPTPFLTLNVANILLYALFLVLSVIDGAWFLATEVYITGLELGTGLASCILTGGLAVLASLQLRESTFWVYTVALVCSTTVLALQLATVLSILIKGDSALLRAIRVSV